MEADTLIISPDTLYLFLDEAGEPSASAPAFCIAGCTIHAISVEGIEKAWKAMKREHFGSEDFPFHASSDAVKRAPKTAHQAVLDFFKQPFGRFAVGYHGKTVVADPDTRYGACAGLMQHRGFIDIIKWCPFRKLALVFEDSERDRELIQRNFGGFKIEENGVAIEPDFYFLPKAADFACLEMADAIANVSYREILRRYEGKKEDFGYDFKEIFHSVEDKHKYFCGIDTITVNEPAKEPA